MIDPARLHALFDGLAAHGGTDDGGMHRLALSAADGAARDALRAWMTAHGLIVTVDAIGNMVGLLDWAGPGRAGGDDGIASR